MRAGEATAGKAAAGNSEKAAASRVSMEKGAKDASGRETTMTVKQSLITVGSTRGDQVAILSGVQEGDVIVTSGHFKLKTGSAVVIDNKVQPKNDAAPRPVDE